MKIIFVVVTAILLVSCEKNMDNKMVTKINSDGTCYREFSANVDTLFVSGNSVKNPFPVKLDSSWVVTCSYATSGGITHNFTKWPEKDLIFGKDTAKYKLIKAIIKKNYSSVQQMGENFRFNNSKWAAIIPKVQLSKKFRWFYTFYDYKEIYPKYNPIKIVPVEKYLTKDEIQMYFGENPKFPESLNGSEVKDLLNEIDNKVNQWVSHVSFVDLYVFFSKKLSLLKDFKIDSASFMEKKDSVYNTLNYSKDPNDQLIKKLDEYFKTKAFSKFQNENQEEVKKAKENIVELVSPPFFMDLSYSLIMPGKIVKSNAKETEGDTLTWKVNAERFFFLDYEIHAESRIINNWAFIVSGLFIIGVALSFLIKKKR